MKYYYAIAFCNIFLFGVKAFFEFSYCVGFFFAFCYVLMQSFTVAQSHPILCHIFLPCQQNNLYLLYLFFSIIEPLLHSLKYTDILCFSQCANYYDIRTARTCQRREYVKSMCLKMLLFWGEEGVLWITENSQGAASESMIVKCISTLRIRFPK